MLAKLRYLLVVSAIAWPIYPAASAAGADESSTGLVQTRPTTGRYVETDRGYMVPYAMTIPGTEVSFAMEPIPGGVFKMGSPQDEPGRHNGEGPQVAVRVEPFWMGRCEVTWAEYRQFMKSYELFKAALSRREYVVTDQNRIDAVTAPTPLYDPSFTFILGDRDHHPAVTMSQYAAKQYTKWLSKLTGHIYRLPSEAEWEYACRAGTESTYHFGNDAAQLDEYAWYFDNSDETYHPVAQKKPNTWGLYDMHGNVAELVLDQYRPDHYGTLGEGPVSADKAIAWPDKMFPHVIRGGSWDDDPEALRSAARSYTEDWRNEDPQLPKSPWWFTDEPALRVGFRIVRPLNPPAAADRTRFWDADYPQLEQVIKDRIDEGRGVYGLVPGPEGRNE